MNVAQLNQVGALCTCFNLRKASRVVTQFYDRQLEPSGLLVTQFTILVAIALLRSGTINELAQGLAMDRTTLTRNLKPLEREGSIKIESGQDRRTRVVCLTQAGQASLNKALPLWEQAQASIVEQLGQERWSTLVSHLQVTTALVNEI